jgi:hypothetical protein
LGDPTTGCKGNPARNGWQLFNLPHEVPDFSGRLVWSSLQQEMGPFKVYNAASSRKSGEILTSLAWNEAVFGGAHVKSRSVYRAQLIAYIHTRDRPKPRHKGRR